MSHFDENLSAVFRHKITEPNNTKSEGLKFEDNQVQFIPVRLQNESQQNEYSRLLTGFDSQHSYSTAELRSIQKFNELFKKVIVLPGDKNFLKCIPETITKFESIKSIEEDTLHHWKSYFGESHNVGHNSEGVQKAKENEHCTRKYNGNDNQNETIEDKQGPFQTRKSTILMKGIFVHNEFRYKMNKFLDSQNYIDTSAQPKNYRDSFLYPTLFRSQEQDIENGLSKKKFYHSAGEIEITSNIEKMKECKKNRSPTRSSNEITDKISHLNKNILEIICSISLEDRVQSSRKSTSVSRLATTEDTERNARSSASLIKSCEKDNQDIKIQIEEILNKLRVAIKNTQLKTCGCPLKILYDLTDEGNICKSEKEKYVDIHSFVDEAFKKKCIEDLPYEDKEQIGRKVKELMEKINYTTRNICEENDEDDLESKEQPQITIEHIVGSKFETEKIKDLNGNKKLQEDNEEYISGEYSSIDDKTKQERINKLKKLVKEMMAKRDCICSKNSASIEDDSDKSVRSYVEDTDSAKSDASSATSVTEDSNREYSSLTISRGSSRRVSFEDQNEDSSNNVANLSAEGDKVEHDVNVPIDVVKSKISSSKDLKTVDHRNNNSGLVEGSEITRYIDASTNTEIMKDGRQLKEKQLLRDEFRESSYEYEIHKISQEKKLIQKDNRRNGDNRHLGELEVEPRNKVSHDQIDMLDSIKNRNNENNPMKGIEKSKEYMEIPISFRGSQTYKISNVYEIEKEFKEVMKFFANIKEFILSKAEDIRRKNEKFHKGSINQKRIMINYNPKEDVSINKRKFSTAAFEKSDKKMIRTSVDIDQNLKKESEKLERNNMQQINEHYRNEYNKTRKPYAETEYNTKLVEEYNRIFPLVPHDPPKFIQRRRENRSRKKSWDIKSADKKDYSGNDLKKSDRNTGKKTNEEKSEVLRRYSREATLKETKYEGYQNDHEKQHETLTFKDTIPKNLKPEQNIGIGTKNIEGKVQKRKLSGSPMNKVSSFSRKKSFIRNSEPQISAAEKIRNTIQKPYEIKGTAKLEETFEARRYSAQPDTTKRGAKLKLIPERSSDKTQQLKSEELHERSRKVGSNESELTTTIQKSATIPNKIETSKDKNKPHVIPMDASKHEVPNKNSTSTGTNISEYPISKNIFASKKIGTGNVDDKTGKESQTPFQNLEFQDVSKRMDIVEKQISCETLDSLFGLEYLLARRQTDCCKQISDQDMGYKNIHSSSYSTKDDDAVNIQSFTIPKIQNLDKKDTPRDTSTQMKRGSKIQICQKRSYMNEIAPRSFISKTRAYKPSNKENISFQGREILKNLPQIEPRSCIPTPRLPPIYERIEANKTVMKWYDANIPQNTDTDMCRKQITSLKGFKTQALDSHLSSGSKIFRKKQSDKYFTLKQKDTSLQLTSNKMKISPELIETTPSEKVACSSTHIKKMNIKKPTDGNYNKNSKQINSSEMMESISKPVLSSSNATTVYNRKKSATIDDTSVGIKKPEILPRDISTKNQTDNSGDYNFRRSENGTKIFDTSFKNKDKLRVVANKKESHNEGRNNENKQNVNKKSLDQAPNNEPSKQHLEKLVEMNASNKYLIPLTEMSNLNEFDVGLSKNNLRGTTETKVSKDKILKPQLLKLHNKGKETSTDQMKNETETNKMFDPIKKVEETMKSQMNTRKPTKHELKHGISNGTKGHEFLNDALNESIKFSGDISNLDLNGKVTCKLQNKNLNTHVARNRTTRQSSRISFNNGDISKIAKYGDILEDISLDRAKELDEISATLRKKKTKIRTNFMPKRPFGEKCEYSFIDIDSAWSSSSVKTSVTVCEDRSPERPQSISSVNKRISFQKDGMRKESEQTRTNCVSPRKNKLQNCCMDSELKKAKGYRNIICHPEPEDSESLPNSSCAIRYSKNLKMYSDSRNYTRRPFEHDKSIKIPSTSRDANSVNNPISEFSGSIPTSKESDMNCSFFSACDITSKNSLCGCPTVENVAEQDEESEGVPKVCYSRATERLIRTKSQEKDLGLIYKQISFPEGCRYRSMKRFDEKEELTSDSGMSNSFISENLDMRKRIRKRSKSEKCVKFQLCEDSLRKRSVSLDLGLQKQYENNNEQICKDIFICKGAFNSLIENTSEIKIENEQYDKCRDRAGYSPTIKKISASKKMRSVFVNVHEKRKTNPKYRNRPKEMRKKAICNEEHAYIFNNIDSHLFLKSIISLNITENRDPSCFNAFLDILSISERRIFQTSHSKNFQVPSLDRYIFEKFSQTTSRSYWDIDTFVYTSYYQLNDVVKKDRLAKRFKRKKDFERSEKKRNLLDNYEKQRSFRLRKPHKIGNSLLIPASVGKFVECGISRADISKGKHEKYQYNNISHHLNDSVEHFNNVCEKTYPKENDDINNTKIALDDFSAESVSVTEIGIGKEVTLNSNNSVHEKYSKHTEILKHETTPFKNNQLIYRASIELQNDGDQIINHHTQYRIKSNHKGRTKQFFNWFKSFRTKQKKQEKPINQETLNKDLEQMWRTEANLMRQRKVLRSKLRYPKSRTSKLYLHKREFSEMQRENLHAGYIDPVLMKIPSSEILEPDYDEELDTSSEEVDVEERKEEKDKRMIVFSEDSMVLFERKVLYDRLQQYGKLFYTIYVDEDEDFDHISIRSAESVEHKIECEDKPFFATYELGPNDLRVHVTKDTLDAKKKEVIYRDENRVECQNSQVKLSLMRGKRYLADLDPTKAKIIEIDCSNQFSEIKICYKKTEASKECICEPPNVCKAIQLESSDLSSSDMSKEDKAEDTHELCEACRECREDPETCDDYEKCLEDNLCASKRKVTIGITSSVRIQYCRIPQKIMFPTEGSDDDYIETDSNSDDHKRSHKSYRNYTSNRKRQKRKNWKRNQHPEAK